MTVMKKISLAKVEYRFYSALVFSAVLAVAIIVMLVHIQALMSQIALLENQQSGLTTKVASYEQRLCSNSSQNNQVAHATEFAKYSIQSAGYTRTYQVHAPANYDPSVRYPVIVSFDGIEGSGSRMESYAGLDELPAVVVYPDSLPGKLGFTAWEGAPYSLDGEQDAQFVRSIVSTLPSQYCIDTTRVFAVGMSNGGAFANIVGCKLGDQIRAVASISGAYYTSCRQENRTPSLLIVHSANDKQAPFAGSVSRRLPHIPSWVEEQATQRGCKTKLPSTTVGSVTHFNWLNCSDTSTLRLTVLQNQPHGWLMMPEMPELSVQSSAGYIWKFFEESSYRG